MTTDKLLADQKENLRDVLSQMKYIHQRIGQLLSEPERIVKEDEKGHPLYNLKMAMYWLRKIECIKI